MKDTRGVMASYPLEAVKKAMEDVMKQLGYAALTRHQALAVEAFLSRGDVFVSLPIGSGKSLCYCVLLKAFDLLHRSTCTDTQLVAIVVNPLVSLMVDQVRHMTERHVSAIYVGDCDDKSEADVCDSVYQLVYISPEALLTNDTWREMLLSPVYQENLVAVVVDEAHCVKKWLVFI